MNNIKRKQLPVCYEFKNEKDLSILIDFLKYKLNQSKNGIEVEIKYTKLGKE